jgi:hypothetical protein
MLMLPDKEVYYSGVMTPVWELPNLKRRLSGLGFAIRWQNVYRKLPILGLGTHFEEGKLYSDIGFGISINIVGFHMFFGLLFESHGERK